MRTTKKPQPHDAPTLDADMRISDVVEALRALRFGSNDGERRTVALDAGVRDCLVEALQRK